MTPPPDFSFLFNVAGKTPEEAKTAWDSLNKTACSDFLTWLVKNSGLNKKELGKLETVLNGIIKKEIPGENYLEAVLGVLDKKKKTAAVDKLAEVFAGNLRKTWENLKENAGVEEKSALENYLKTRYGRTSF